LSITDTKKAERGLELTQKQRSARGRMMWLEYGYEPEDLKVIGDAESLGVDFEC